MKKIMMGAIWSGCTLVALMICVLIFATLMALVLDNGEKIENRDSGNSAGSSGRGGSAAERPSLPEHRSQD